MEKKRIIIDVEISSTPNTTESQREEKLEEIVKELEWHIKNFYLADWQMRIHYNWEEYDVADVDISVKVAETKE